MFSTRLRRIHIVHVFFMLFAVSQVTQAQPGASDSGNSNVQAQVPAGKILLTGVTDLAFLPWDGGTG